MRHEADKDFRSAFVRAVGVLVGLAVVLGLVYPFDGVPPPSDGSARPAPATLEVRALASGEFEILPVGKVLKPTVLPAPGVRGGPTLALKVRNMTGLTLRVSVRFTGLTPTLDQAVKVRASVGGGVVANGPLGVVDEWTPAAGLLRSGQQSTLRMRFKLLPGIEDDLWRGKVDVRQLELRGVMLNGQPVAGPETQMTLVPPTQPSITSPGMAPQTTPPPAATGEKLGPPLVGGEFGGVESAPPRGSEGTTP